MINYTNLGDALPEVCDNLSITLRSPLYRAAQIINLLESVMACVLIIFVTLKYRQKLIFHPNTKILLFFLFLACFVHACGYSSAKIYQLSLSFSVTDNCRLFLPQMFYVINHLVIACSNCFMQYIQLGFVVERCVATIFVDTYETHCRLLGVFLVMVVVIVTCVTTYGEYIGIRSAERMTNCMISTSDPSSIAITFCVIFALCCSSLLITLSLYCFNSKRKKRTTMASRYQTSENVAASALQCVISTIQLVCFAVYASAMTYIRLTKGSDARWDPYKELAYLVPLCTLAIPLGSLIFLELWKLKRQRGIDGMISVKSQGPEGLNNYLTLLKQQWQ
ncbi:hypothetical protein Q1695_006846 [Nippostrongylus brasiliensis]|nr:hypothetical protein Q1695_006846 [Nippostrongylus brasiliensis]